MPPRKRVRTSPVPDAPNKQPRIEGSTVVNDRDNDAAAAKGGPSSSAEIPASTPIADPNAPKADSDGETLDADSNSGDGVLDLNINKIFKPELLDSSLAHHLTCFEKNRQYKLIPLNEVTWNSTNDEVGPISFASLMPELNVNLNYMHKLLRFINVRSWSVFGAQVINPLFVDESGISFRGTYGTLSHGKKDLVMGMLALHSRSETCLTYVAPVRHMWNMLARFLVTVGGHTIPLGFMTDKVHDLIFKLPTVARSNVPSSPTKSGRDNAPESTAPPILFDAELTPSGAFDISKPIARKARLTEGELVFIVFTLRKWYNEGTNKWYLNPVQLIALPTVPTESTEEPEELEELEELEEIEQ